MTDMSCSARFIEAEHSGELAGAELAEWITTELAAVVRGCDGVFTATGGAGAAESVSFWAGISERGARLANPRIFPWTLASAPAGHLAMAYDVRGPVVNFVGGSEAADAAIEAAIDHVDDGIVERAAVVAFDRTCGRTMAAALVVDALVVDAPGRVICGAGDALAVNRLTAVHRRVPVQRIA